LAFSADLEKAEMSCASEETIMPNDKNNPPPLPRTTIDEAVGPWGPGPHPSGGTVTRGTGGDLNKLMRRIQPPQPRPQVVRKGS